MKKDTIVGVFIHKKKHIYLVALHWSCSSSLVSN